ncbi:MAG: glutamate 5-kinase [Proteobacteria bacterium]|nr:glutamate 5-kinase [Pseudomonadota bacterium]
MSATPRQQVVAARRIIVKVGSSLLTAAGSGLDVAYINNLCEQIAAARSNGYEVVVVSSGAVAAGVRKLGWQQRPTARVDMQVVAAVGQMGLINAYEDAFARHHLHAAQVMLTAEDMGHRTLYLNARATLRQMLQYSVIPVINENDVIATDSVSFGDNDRLAAQIANLIEADLLLMLTEAPGLCRDGENMCDVVQQAAVTDEHLATYARAGNSVGSGGIRSKLAAARVAARSGAHSLIADGRDKNCIQRALSGDAEFGTLLVADIPRLSARKQWLASGLNVCGNMVLDQGAVTAVVGGKRSLLSAGVTAVYGDFVRGDAVKLSDEAGNIIGYALVNYDSIAARNLCGVQSSAIADILGYRHEEEIVHRDNMTILR